LTGDLSVDDITKECTAAGKPAVKKQPFPDQAQRRALTFAGNEPHTWINVPRLVRRR
jgi:hypothetical protein